MDKQEFIEALEKKLEPVFNCTSCGKPFTQHDGIIRTCEKLQGVQAELDAVKLCPADFFGQAISLQLAIKEINNELTVDICKNCPRLVLMVFFDLERQAEEIVEAMKAKS